MAELIWLLAFSGQSFHFLSTYFSSSNSAKFPSASAPLKWSLQLPISCRGWLFLKLLYFSNCDGWLMIMERLTLVLFSRSVCTSFWDPPHSQYSLRQRESRYIMIVLYCVCVSARCQETLHPNTHRHTKKKKKEMFLCPFISGRPCTESLCTLTSNTQSFLGISAKVALQRWEKSTIPCSFELFYQIQRLCTRCKNSYWKPNIQPLFLNQYSAQLRPHTLTQIDTDTHQSISQCRTQMVTSSELL